MLTFYDPIEMDDIDIDDSAANFYIIRTDENKYKFCALTQNLDSLQMQAGDPETRVKEYWPISREQLSHANMETLFPEDIAHNRKLRTAPFTLEQLNATFNFNPPFNPNTLPQRTFGQQQAQPHIPNNFQQTIQNAIGNGLFTAADLAGMSSYEIEAITKPECLQALQDGLFTVANMPRDGQGALIAFAKPVCIQAIRDGLFTAADLAGMSSYKIEAITKPECLQALQDGHITIENISNMTIAEINQANLNGYVYIGGPNM